MQYELLIMESNLILYRFSEKPETSGLQPFLPDNHPDGIRDWPVTEDFASISGCMYHFPDTVKSSDIERFSVPPAPTPGLRLAIRIPGMMDKGAFMQYRQCMQTYEEWVVCILADCSTGTAGDIIGNLRSFFRFRASFPLPESYIISAVQPGPADIQLFAILGFSGFAVPENIGTKSTATLLPTPGTSHTPPEDPELERLRTKLDTTDHQLLDLLCERLSTLGEVAGVKARHHLTAFHPERWKKMLDRLTTTAQNQNVDPEVLLEIYEQIHISALRILAERMLRKENQS